MKKFIVLLTVFVLAMMTASSAVAGGGKGWWHIYVTNKSSYSIRLIHWAFMESSEDTIVVPASSGGLAVEYDIPYEGVKCPSGFRLSYWEDSMWWSIKVGPLYFDRTDKGRFPCCWNIYLTINADLTYSWTP